MGEKMFKGMDDELRKMFVREENLDRSRLQVWQEMAIQWDHGDGWRQLEQHQHPLFAALWMQLWGPAYVRRMHWAQVLRRSCISLAETALCDRTASFVVAQHVSYESKVRIELWRWHFVIWEESWFEKIVPRMSQDRTNKLKLDLLVLKNRFNFVQPRTQGYPTICTSVIEHPWNLKQL